MDVFSTDGLDVMPKRVYAISTCYADRTPIFAGADHVSL
jgi:hypothetical protein